MKSVIIKSSSNSIELQLSEQEGLSRPEGSEYYRVALKAKNLIASAKIYAFEPHSELAQYFSDLAVHWKGWNGEKKWNSLEREFTLSCTSDSQGHIAMEVELKSRVNEEYWSVLVEVNVDAGHLEEIASNVKRFFSIQTDS